MKSPTDDEINRTLDQLSRTRIELVNEWQSDAEREGLPITNVHDERGAPVLRTDDVLRWEPGHLGRR